MDSERFVRQRALFGPGEQERLRDTNVVIVGCGGLGSQLIADLVSAGMAHFVLVDGDTVEPSNLNRQFIHFGNLGMRKVDSAGRWIKTADPGAEVTGYARMLDADNASEIVSSGDIVADCTDNVGTRRILAEACRRAGRTLVHAGVEGRYGQVMTFLPDAPVTLGEIVGKKDVPDHISYAPAVSLVGAVQADELIMTVLGRSEPGTLITVDLENRSMERRSFPIR